MKFYNNNEYKSAIALAHTLEKSYDEGKPVISDKKYDELYFAIQEYEQEFGYALPDSPTQAIKYQVVSELKKVAHSHPMLSANKTKSIDEVEKFAAKNAVLAMWKLDGLSLSLTYENGYLVRAETRGDGEIGEDVTHNAMAVSNIPKRLPQPLNCTVDGEIISTYDNFKRFDTEYKNPRNFASGSIRLLDNKVSQERGLSFYAWETDIEEYKGIPVVTLEGKLTLLQDSLGFDTAAWIEPILGELIEVADELKDWAEQEGIPIDGIIFKYNNIQEFKDAGMTAHHPVGMLAYKFYDEEYQSTLTDIVWQLGRQGTLTPVAEFQPIDIDGTTVSRASLHNVSVLKEKLGDEPHFGQVVYVTKRNQIIPQIERSDIFGVYTDDDLFIIPNVCPVCGGQTAITESEAGVKELVCQNPDCQGKINKKIEHFCSKKGLDIKGISEKTIEFLYNKGWLNSVEDIFKLRDHYSDWIVEKGWGKASVDKTIKAIDEAKDCELHKFISALGIPLIGEIEAKSIAKNVNNDYIDMRVLFDRTHDYAFSVINSWSGFGPAKAEAILSYDWRDADDIAKYITFKKVAEAPASSSLEGEVICITGTLKECKNRDDLKNIIEQNGGKVASSVTSKTTLLVNNDINSTSAKNKKAKELGIPIISEHELLIRTK